MVWIHKLGSFGLPCILLFCILSNLGLDSASNELFSLITGKANDQFVWKQMMTDMADSGIIPNPFQAGKLPATSESNVSGSFDLATTAAQLSGSPSVFPNVGITPCQLPMDVGGPSPKMEIATGGTAPQPVRSGSKNGSAQGKQVQLYIFWIKST